MQRPGVKPVTSRSRVRLANHYTTKPLSWLIIICIGAACWNAEGAKSQSNSEHKDSEGFEEWFLVSNIGAWGSIVTFHSGVQGGTPATSAFRWICSSENASVSSSFWCSKLSWIDNREHLIPHNSWSRDKIVRTKCHSSAVSLVLTGWSSEKYAAKFCNFITSSNVDWFWKLSYI